MNTTQKTTLLLSVFFSAAAYAQTSAPTTGTTNSTSTGVNTSLSPTPNTPNNTGVGQNIRNSPNTTLERGTLDDTNRGIGLSSPSSLNSRQTIIDAQRALVSQGFSVSTDGVMGPATQTAVRRFQARNGLPQTGTLNSETLKALNVTTPANQAE